jgi:hypothetical protein
LWSSFSPGKCGSSRESDGAPAKARRDFWFRAGRRRTLIIFATREQACNPVAPQSRGERHMSPLCAERPPGGVHYRYRGTTLCHFYTPFGPSDRRGSRLVGQGEDTNRAEICSLVQGCARCRGTRTGAGGRPWSVGRAGAGSGLWVLSRSRVPSERLSQVHEALACSPLTPIMAWRIGDRYERVTMRVLE